MPKLHHAVLMAALAVTSTHADAQRPPHRHRRYVCLPTNPAPPGLDAVRASLSPTSYAGGVALLVGGLGLAVRARRR